jgi:hypothetical protein
MDEQNLPKGASGIVDPADPEQPAQPATDSAVAFFGDPARVREGFAIALRAMGFGAAIPDAIPGDQSEQGE